MRGTEQWIFTYSSRTGELLKLERVDPVQGARRGSAPEEDGALAGVRSVSCDPAACERAYYQGWIDYASSLGGCHAFLSPAEAAYYQGMADYAAYLALT